jgi:hypothetical protein
LKGRLKHYVRILLPKKRELQVTTETFMDVCDEIESLLPYAAPPISPVLVDVLLYCI